MNNLEYIAANLSDEDILCAIAEEAAELAQAALKLCRAITGTNPTPVSVEQAIGDLIEEYADTAGTFDVWVNKKYPEGELNIGCYILEKIDEKYVRWAKRLKEAKNDRKS